MFFKFFKTKKIFTTYRDENCMKYYVLYELLIFDLFLYRW